MVNNKPRYSILCAVPFPCLSPSCSTWRRTLIPSSSIPGVPSPPWGSGSPCWGLGFCCGSLSQWTACPSYDPSPALWEGGDHRWGVVTSIKNITINRRSATHKLRQTDWHWDRQTHTQTAYRGLWVCRWGCCFQPSPGVSVSCSAVEPPGRTGHPADQCCSTSHLYNHNTGNRPDREPWHLCCLGIKWYIVHGPSLPEKKSSSSLYPSPQKCDIFGSEGIESV